MRVERKGLPISSGIAFGKVVLLDRTRMIVERIQIDEHQIDKEKERFSQALRRSKSQLFSIRDTLEPLEGGDHLQILNINIMMLEDEILSEEVLNFIESERINAEWAVNNILSRKSEAFRKVEDHYMKERLADIYYLGERILRNLHGVSEDIPNLGHDSILVAHDISAVDVVAFAKHNAIGIATDTGASTSHSAIVAKSLGIPTVMGLEDITMRASPGDTIFIDGFRGIVVLDPDEKEQEEIGQRRSGYIALEKKLLEYAKLPGRTLDGREIKVNANIEITEELNHAICYGAEGIGMYRTEFLFTKSVYFPDEEEQYESYKKVISALSSPLVTIRTLDIGGDKFPPGMEPSKRLNPALGLRGIRFSLRDEGTFRTQIRAILRATEGRRVRILLPMVSDITEITEAKSIISKIADELDKRDFWDIGVMIETPSAAILAPDISEDVDFLSIGTNDLIQYTLAVDRVNEHVSYLYTPFHPAVLRLIKGVTESAHEKGIPVSVCGEMASQLPCVPLLVGMGVDELSMNTHSIPRVKKLLSVITEMESREITGKCLLLKTGNEIKDCVSKSIIQKWGESLPPDFIVEIASGT
ncbi:MAG: phosphoenolpyruvate--protein phosphotransferase [Thermodesulfobacteriota bacterium]